MKGLIYRVKLWKTKREIEKSVEEWEKVVEGMGNWEKYFGKDLEGVEDRGFEKGSGKKGEEN